MKNNKKKPTAGRDKAPYKPRGGRVKVTDEHVFAQSRLTNGKDLLPFVDGRGHFARIMRDSLTRLVAHCGGADVISEPRRMMARRCSLLETELIFMESKFARIRAEGGEPAIADVDAYSRIAGNQRRIAEALGWERTARDVTPSLGEYLSTKYAAQAEDVA